MKIMGYTCNDCGHFVRLGDSILHKCSKYLLKKRRKARAARIAKREAKEAQQAMILKELREIKQLLLKRRA